MSVQYGLLIAESLRNFKIISWNIAGIRSNLKSIQQFTENVGVQTALSLMFVQEFDSSETSKTAQTASHKLYISPGLSKHSRSNANVIPKLLVPHVLGHGFCCLGQVLMLKSGGRVFCYMNVHLPFDGHNMCLEEALEELDNLLAQFESKLLKLKIDKRKVVWVLGGDLNDDIRLNKTRSHSIKHIRDCNSNSTCP